MRGYIYANRLVWDKPDLVRAYIDASLRHRNKSEARSDIHKLYPLRFNPAQITEWIHDTRAQVRRIQYERQRFEAGEPGAWPRACGEGCMQYGQCPYFEICMSAEPVQEIQRPATMITKFWNPIKLHANLPEEVVE